LITCKQLIQEYLDSYAGGKLDERQTDLFVQHLKACPDCQDYVSTYLRTIQLCREAYRDDPEPPTEFIDHLLERIRKA